jgi:2-polyprenyl-6-hydroxyphenyl methylase/3-demethylubiquinone-9 3-methyltransferase
MQVDNHLYDAMADSWWDESGPLHTLRGLNPGRFGYMRRVLLEDLRVDPSGQRTLDVGCGGGLLAEEFARLGFAVTGIDPSGKSLEAAQAHAEEEGLPIDYRQASGEEIPFPDGSFEIVYCCDVLEHVEAPEKVVVEISRVLQPDGVFLYDTINRTLRSWLVVIKLFQDWEWTRFMPPGLHDWRRFVKPKELLSVLARTGLENRDLTGLAPEAGAIEILRLLRARKRGEISSYETARRMGLREAPDTRVSYIGYAIKAGWEEGHWDRRRPRRPLPRAASNDAGSPELEGPRRR